MNDKHNWINYMPSPLDFASTEVDENIKRYIGC